MAEWAAPPFLVETGSALSCVEEGAPGSLLGTDVLVAGKGPEQLPWLCAPALVS